MKSGFILAATSSGAGKTTLTLGVMQALANRGLKIQGYKVGPDYIDPAFHFFATGQTSRNLDGWMLDDETLLHLFHKAAEPADVCVVEGVMGLFDGSTSDPERGSSAHIARLTGLPVVLIIDGSGTFTSAAAMVKGFKEFDPRVQIGGVIVNRVSSQVHYDLIKRAVETHTGVPCLGYMKKNNNLSLSSRHLGLIPSHEMDNVREKIDLMASEVEATVNLEGLLQLSMSSEGFYPPQPVVSAHLNAFKDIRMAVAWDKAFNFYYEDNLQLLQELGVELVKFSPMEDSALPTDVHGLYLGGGFPEVFPKTLSENQTMLRSIQAAVEAEMPVYAECGGLMYLCRSLTDFEGVTYAMTDVLPLQTRMTKKLQRFGYVEVTLGADCLLGPAGTTFRAHEFHRSVTEPVAETVTEDGDSTQSIQVYNIAKNSMGTETTWQCGYVRKHVLAAYAHLHFYAQPSTAVSFLENCKAWKNRVGGSQSCKI